MAGEQENVAGGTPLENFWAAQDGPYRVDWSRTLDRRWELDPVLLNRRQTGKPEYPDSDLTNKAVGIELRKRF